MCGRDLIHERVRPFLGSKLRDEHGQERLGGYPELGTHDLPIPYRRVIGDAIWDHPNSVASVALADERINLALCNGDDRGRPRPHRGEEDSLVDAIRP